MIRNRTGSSFAVLAALGLTLFSCTGEKQPARASSPAVKKLDVVRMNVNNHIGYGPFFVAKEEGFFEAEGIDGQLVPLDGQNSIIAIASGTIDVLATPVRSGVFNVMLRGVDLQIVAERGHVSSKGCQAEAFTAPLATAERIATKGFAGEKFSLIRGGNQEFQIDQLLRRNGLSVRDVTLILLPAGGDYLTSQSRKVDAVRYMQEPMLSNALATGSVKVVARMDAAAPEQPLSLIAFGKRLLRENPELGRRFMRAYLRGVRRLNEGKTVRNVEILSRHTKLPAEIVSQACWQSISNDARLKPESLEPFFAWARTNSHLDGEMPASLWWNPAFLDAANRDLATESTAAAR